MSRCGSNSNGWAQQQPSPNGFSPPQFMNIPGLTPYGGQPRCSSSSPCCSAGFSPFCPQFPQNMGFSMNRSPQMPQMGRPANGIRLRCPSCCRPMGSCTCGCCASQSKTYY